MPGMNALDPATKFYEGLSPHLTPGTLTVDSHNVHQLHVYTEHAERLVCADDLEKGGGMGTRIKTGRSLSKPKHNCCPTN